MKDHAEALPSHEVSDASAQDEVADSPTQVGNTGAQEPRRPEGTSEPQIHGFMLGGAWRRTEARQDTAQRISDSPSAGERPNSPLAQPEQGPQPASTGEQSSSRTQDTVARSSARPHVDYETGAVEPFPLSYYARPPESYLRINPHRSSPGTLLNPTMRTTLGLNPLRPFPGPQDPSVVPGPAASAVSGAQSSSATPTEASNPFSDPPRPSAPDPFPGRGIPYSPRGMLQAWLIRQQRLAGIPETMLRPMGTAHRPPASHRPAPPAPGATGDPVPPSIGSASVSEAVRSNLLVTPGPHAFGQESDPDSPDPGSSPTSSGLISAPISESDFSGSDSDDSLVAPSSPDSDHLAVPGSPTENPLDDPDLTITGLDTARDFAPAEGPQDASNLPTAGSDHGPGPSSTSSQPAASDYAPARESQGASNVSTSGSDNAPGSVVTSDLPAALDPASRSDEVTLASPSVPIVGSENPSQHVAQSLSADYAPDPRLIALLQPLRLHATGEPDSPAMQDSPPESGAHENRETARLHLQSRERNASFIVLNRTDADSISSQEAGSQEAGSQEASSREASSREASSQDDLGVETSSIESQGSEDIPNPIPSPIPDGALAPSPSLASAEGGASANASPGETSETSGGLPVTFVWAQDDEDQPRQRFVIDGTDDGLI
ncbi:uncharacterized protein N7515_000963 [Penicillium bovifimosum]|uniref:Uncharacterized protein n=1 Tax=Penicillium bovifimosum TaxID=126998 RepID=A0A9W9HFY5_9EURO|nr:uncharacterized protein N7515_000963 [Penicillium bovifimosum]KAJ5146399.1 hypothetical protein N7515_000963 [Penicillium bovifimosum]